VTTNIIPKKSILAWIKHNRITTSEFSRTMKYTYGYAWQVLHGKRDVSFELIGRMAVFYGCDSISTILQDASKQKRVS
jgi:hypothetical protein